MSKDWGERKIKKKFFNKIIFFPHEYPDFISMFTNKWPVLGFPSLAARGQRELQFPIAFP